MNILASIIVGAFSAVIAVLLHQTLPPLGVAIALIFTYCVIWFVGRRYGGRKYKWVATIAWILVIFRASTFGAGQELLVQGDGAGSALLLLGTLIALAAVASRI